MATHHRIKAMYHLFYSMQYDSLVKDEEDFRKRILPIFDMLVEGHIETTDKSLDELTEDARKKLKELKIIPII